MKFDNTYNFKNVIAHLKKLLQFFSDGVTDRIIVSQVYYHFTATCRYCQFHLMKLAPNFIPPIAIAIVTNSLVNIRQSKRRDVYEKKRVFYFLHPKNKNEVPLASQK